MMMKYSCELVTHLFCENVHSYHPQFFELEGEGGGEYNVRVLSIISTGKMSLDDFT